MRTVSQKMFAGRRVDSGRGAEDVALLRRRLSAAAAVNRATLTRLEEEMAERLRMERRFAEEVERRERAESVARARSREAEMLLARAVAIAEIAAEDRQAAVGDRDEAIRERDDALRLFRGLVGRLEDVDRRAGQNRDEGVGCSSAPA